MTRPKEKKKKEKDKRVCAHCDFQILMCVYK